MKLGLQSNLGWSHCSDTVAAHCQSRLASSSPHQNGWIISVKKYAEEKYFCQVVQFGTNIALYVKCSKMRLYISSRGHFKQLWAVIFHIHLSSPSPYSREMKNSIALTNCCTFTISHSFSSHIAFLLISLDFTNISIVVCIFLNLQMLLWGQ